MKRIVLLALVCNIFQASVQRVVQVKEGNLALSTSQQPTPLFLYGQNIVDKGDIQGELYIDWHKGKNQTFIDILPGVLYGVNDRFSLFFITPITPKYQVNSYRSSGFEDFFIQGEYAALYKEKEQSTSMITIIGSLYLPTGSTKKNPATGFGSPSFFIGATASYLSVEWYAVVAPCALFTTSNSGTKSGNIFYYQGCLGRNIFGDPDGWILTGMIELFGIYQTASKINGILDPNSGSNITYVGPTLWSSSRKFFGQVGILFPAAQNYRGNQNKNTFLLAVDLGWRFNV